MIEPDVKIHSGSAYMERIDDVLKKLNEDETAVIRVIAGEMKAARKARIKNRFCLLRVLFREIYPVMSEDEKKGHTAKHDELRKELNVLLKEDKLSSSFMDSWELELRNMVNKKGLLLPNHRGDDDGPIY